jgi:septum formation protein
MEEAGLCFDIVPADLDEAAAKRLADLEGWSARELALRLAVAKAQAISNRRPHDVVIGADQVLSSGSRRFDKPPTLEAARSHLTQLRGTNQVLDTAVVLVQSGIVLWQHVCAQHLTMRFFSDTLLDLYISTEGDALLSCVGACRVEGIGQHLFEVIDADRSAILGMPILPLLHELRRRGLIID